MKKYIFGIIFLCLEVQSAELKIYCWDITGSDGESWLQIYSTTEFDEYTITWNFRPPPLDLLLDYDSHFSENAWYTFSSPELTAYVSDVFSRGEPACFVMKCKNQTLWRRVWWFRTKEYFGKRPTLVYQSQTLYSCDDARVNEAGGGNNNYGYEDRMWACDHGEPQRQASYIEFSSPSQSIEEDVQRNNLNLLQITPNPVLDNFVIKYGLPEKANISLRLYNISGRLVKTLYSGTQEKGYHKVNIGASHDMPTGIYFIRLDAHTGLATGDYRATRKLTILR